MSHGGDVVDRETFFLAKGLWNLLDGSEVLGRELSVRSGGGTFSFAVTQSVLDNCIGD